MRWWLYHGIAGWTVLWLAWGVLSIVYDVLILTIGGGVKSTISWQVQQASIANPVIPVAVGLIIGALTTHFFKLRSEGWFAEGQPWHYWALGFALGAIGVAASWTQIG
jgi:hypothetical protein